VSLPPALRLDAEVAREVTTLKALPGLTRLGAFLVLYASGASAAVVAFDNLSGAKRVVVIVLCAIVAGAALHGISLFAHEGVHGVLSRRRWLNNLLAIASAMPVLQSFFAYRVLHLRHHAALGDADDPDHYPNYTSSRPLLFLMHWGRLLAGYPAYITLIPLLALKRGTVKDRLLIATEAAVLLGVAAAAAWLVPRHWLVLGWAAPMVVIHFLTNVRGMSQHAGLEHADDKVLGSRTFESPAWAAFFLCNENFHLEHHLYPQVPWYHLPRLHEALAPALRAQGASILRGYLAFVAEFARASVSRQTTGSVYVEQA
jgi:fatty acid desaturase